MPRYNELILEMRISYTHVSRMIVIIVQGKPVFMHFYAASTDHEIDVAV